MTASLPTTLPTEEPEVIALPAEPLRSLIPQISGSEIPTRKQLIYAQLLANTTQIRALGARIYLAILRFLACISWLCQYITSPSYREKNKRECNFSALHPVIDGWTTPLWCVIRRAERDGYTSEYQELTYKRERYEMLLQCCRLTEDEMLSPDDLISRCTQVVISACLECDHYQSFPEMQRPRLEKVKELCSLFWYFRLLPTTPYFKVWYSRHSFDALRNHVQTILTRYFFCLARRTSLPAPHKDEAQDPEDRSPTVIPEFEPAAQALS